MNWYSESEKEARRKLSSACSTYAPSRREIARKKLMEERGLCNQFGLWSTKQKDIRPAKSAHKYKAPRARAEYEDLETHHERIMQASETIERYKRAHTSV